MLADQSTRIEPPAGGRVTGANHIDDERADESAEQSAWHIAMLLIDRSRERPALPSGGRAITPLSDDRDDDGLEMLDLPPSAKDVADVELFVLNRGARVLVMDVADLMGLRRATVMRCIAASTRIRIKREYKRVYVVAVGG